MAQRKLGDLHLVNWLWKFLKLEYLVFAVGENYFPTLPTGRASLEVKINY